MAKMYFLALVSFLAVTVLGDLRGFDVSQAQAPFNPNFWKCAHNAGYGKAVIRGYMQACGVVSNHPLRHAQCWRSEVFGQNDPDR